MQKHPEPVHFQRHKGLPKVTPQTPSLGTTPRAAEGGEEELGPWGRAGAVWDMLWMEMDEGGVTSSLWALGSHSSTSPQGWAQGSCCSCRGFGVWGKEEGASPVRGAA